MPETKPTLSLHRKLAQIMYEAERIPKNGRAPAIMGGYPFVQVGDAADYIRKALAEKVITMMPTAVHVTGQQDRATAKGGTMTTVDLITEWTLTDGESGESITIMSFGAGSDGGDKYSGKASTSAMKYALLTGFLLSTGDDTEAHATPETVAPRSLAQIAAALPPLERSNGGLIGIAALGKSAPVDGQLRQTPDGPSVGFVIGEGRDKVQVVAYGPRAEPFAVLLPGILGQRVTVFGSTSDETMKVGQRNVSFVRVRLTKLVTPDATMDFGMEPMKEILDQPPDDVPLVGEAETKPLGLVG